MSFKLSDGTTLEQNFIQDWNVIDQWIGGSLFSCGYGGNGQLGNGTITNKSSPIQIGSLIDWKQTSCSGVHTMFIKLDGTMWGCGYNNQGQIGDSTTVSRSSPVKVGVLTNWRQVASPTGFAGSVHSAAVKTDGTLWTWGVNDAGQVGDATIVSKSSPILVSGQNWKYVACGYKSTVAVKTDGTLWTWGSNIRGQLGKAFDPAATTGVSSPVQVGSLTNWKQVAAATLFAAAIKTDGTLWGWGQNVSGQLGDGSLITKSSPVQIGSLTNWKQLACGGGSTIAIKTDGTMWGWGRNSNGMLSTGDVIHRSSPVQIGSLTNWKQVACGYNSMAAIKTDGTLWGCGYNGMGQLGDGTIVSKSSLIQIGTLTTWKFVSSAGNTVVATTFCEDYL